MKIGSGPRSGNSIALGEELRPLDADVRRHPVDDEWGVVDPHPRADHGRGWGRDGWVPGFLAALRTVLRGRGELNEGRGAP